MPVPSLGQGARLHAVRPAEMACNCKSCLNEVKVSDKSLGYDWGRKKQYLLQFWWSNDDCSFCSNIFSDAQHQPAKGKAAYVGTQTEDALLSRSLWLLQQKAEGKHAAYGSCRGTLWPVVPCEPWPSSKTSNLLNVYVVVSPVR